MTPMVEIADEMVEAAAAAHWRSAMGFEWPGKTAGTEHWINDARAALTATLPLIERAVRDDEAEQCAIIAILHSQYPVEDAFDRGYGRARKDVAAAIRARKNAR